MKRFNVKMLVEAGAMIALALVLNMVTIFKMPAGGSVTAGSMIPIILFAVRWGKGPGALAGAVFGALNFALSEKYSFHPVSILLDYPVPFAMVGFFGGMFGKKVTGIFTGVLTGLLARFICHVISGVVVFSSYAGDQNPWVYSAIYNGTFLIPEMVITVLLVILLIKYIPYFKSK